MTALITALFALLKAMPQIARGIGLIVEAYRKHERDVVDAAIKNTFEQLKAAKSVAEKDQALEALDDTWKRATRR